MSEIIDVPSGAAFGIAASFAGEMVHLPERARVIDDVLEWSAWESPWLMPQGRIGEACLRRFVRLANDSNTQHFADFAMRYGPLYLGSDGWPVGTADALPSRMDDGQGQSTRRVWFQEPLEGWRAWARYIGTVFVLWDELRDADEKIKDPELRLKRVGLDPGSLEPAFEMFEMNDLGWTASERLWPWHLLELLEIGDSADQQWDYLAGEVSTRLLEGVNFAVHMRGTRVSPRVELEQSWNPWLSRQVDSALPMIVGQLVATIIGRERTHVCANCGLPYPVQRRRRNGRCPECRPLARSESTQRSKARRRDREAQQA
jgi:hypothetical protein